MKFVLTGVSGLLGQEVWKCMGDHTGIGIGRTAPKFVPSSQWKRCDLTDAEQVYSIITRENPDLVIHCAAYNDVDTAELNPSLAYRINAIGARNLALACQRFDTELLAVSTDYVFDGDQPPRTGYREFDPTHPINRYAESKLWGEVYIRQLLQKYYIVRTSWLFGPSRNTFVDKVLQWARDRKEIPCVEDMVSAPTYTPDLAKSIKALAESHRYGIYHLTNQGFCNRIQLAEEVLRLHSITEYPHLRILNQNKLRLPARRPSFSGMDNLVWRMDGFPLMRPWQNALQEHFLGVMMR